MNHPCRGKRHQGLAWCSIDVPTSRPYCRHQYCSFMLRDRTFVVGRDHAQVINAECPCRRNKRLDILGRTKRVSPYPVDYIALIRDCHAVVHFLDDATGPILALKCVRHTRDRLIAPATPARMGS